MASTVVSAIDPYIYGTSFTNWVERLEFYFQVSKTPVEDKKAQLIYHSGQQVFDELKLLYPGVDLNTLSYEEIVKKLKSRYDKAESSSMQRFKFHSRIQQPNETLEDFILAVKLLAQECRFGEFKELALCDRYTMGVFDKNLQKRLLEEENMTTASAEKIMYTWELAASRSKLISETNQPGQIAAIRGPIRNRLGNKKSRVEHYASGNGRRTTYRSGYRYNRNDDSFRSEEDRKYKFHKRSKLICDF